MESLNATAESLIVTAESLNATAESLIVTAESLIVTAESLIVTTESLQPPIDHNEHLNGRLELLRVADGCRDAGKTEKQIGITLFS